MDNTRNVELETSHSIDLTSMTVRQLLKLEAGVIRELKRRDLVRTNNKALGDIAEQIVHRARSGVIEPNSTKSHDITTPDGQRIQVKAMIQRRTGAAAKFSQFRSTDFDTAVFLVLDDEEFDLAEAYEVPAQLIHEQARYSAHTNSRQPTLRQVRSLGADVSEEMRSAYRMLDTETRLVNP